MRTAVKCGGKFALVVVTLMLASCGGSKNPQPVNQKKTIPVHGEVYVDDKPGHGVQVKLVPKNPDSANSTTSTGNANEEGKFTIGTYGTNDGAPPGEYSLTFTYSDPTKINVVDAEEGTADQFKGKYSDPKKSTSSVTVPEDATEVNIPRIDLKSK